MPPRLLILAGLLVLATATAGMLLGAEPFATWYYLFAWYSSLLIIDSVVALRSGRFVLLGRPAYVATLLGWSAVFWLFFELLNFRLRNWYYVFVPEDVLSGTLGVILSFATVLPAVFVAEGLLASFGVARESRWPALRVTPRLLLGTRMAGVLALILPLLWPRIFFPLVWGTVTLLLEPSNYRRDPRRSLLGDLERGHPGRLLRLLLGGALVGLLWELFNIGARGKWIYTVPGLEELKLFEMPVLGFLGFPPFALECFAFWQALLLAGLAAPREGRARPAPGWARGIAGGAVLSFVLGVLAGMERHTISSYTPRLQDLPGVPAAALQRAGYDVFSLAEAQPAELAAAVGAVALKPGVGGGGDGGTGSPGHGTSDAGASARGAGAVGAGGSPDGRAPVGCEEITAAEEWVETARLVALRGIGAENTRLLVASGIRSVADLASADPARLIERLERSAGREVVPARVRVWVRAARRALAAGGVGRAGPDGSGTTC